MKHSRVLSAILMLITIYANYFVSYVECAPKSFVDNWVYSDVLLEENFADKFLKEKKEINKLCLADTGEFTFEDFTAGMNNLYTKIEELMKKISERYGENYIDWDVAFASGRLLAWSDELTLTASLFDIFKGHKGDELKRVLQDEDTWKNFQSEFKKISSKSTVPLELNFRMDKRIVSLCKDSLGENNPAVLRRKINLIHDYSLMGDSKTALKIEIELLPKLEKAFGEKSPEVLKILRLMSNDYEILGNYLKSEETLLIAIEIAKKLYSEEKSPELVSVLISFNKLTNATPNTETVIALEKAAKNISTDELYELGYFRFKHLNNPNNDMKRLIDLMLACSQERELIKNYERDAYTKCVDMSFEQGENARVLGLYHSALAQDLMALSDCKMNFGKYHHKTLKALCNLSEDYLTLGQAEDALSLAKEAFDTSKKIYGNEHPCTIRAIHSLTNVYRKMNRYSDALILDKKSYDFCNKVFTEKSGNEPMEKLIVLLDISEDYKGLKNYSLAIKYYEDFFSKHTARNTTPAEVAQARKNLAYLYNLNREYQKTLNLYAFLKQKDASYSLENFPIDGLIAAYSADTLGEALAKTNNNESASKIYSQEIKKFELVRYFNAHDTLENNRKWFADTVPYYKKVASFFVAHNESMDAFIAVELGKGRTLADQYNSLLAMYKGGLSEEDIINLNDYRKKAFRYKDNFKEEFRNGSDAFKFNILSTQLDLISEYSTYNRQLEKKYPDYKKMLSGGNINIGVKSENFFNTEQIKSLIPRNHCYISFSVVKKDAESNFPHNEILVLVSDDTGKVKSFSFKVEDNFFKKCELYHELNSYATIFELNRDGKYFWRIGNEYIITLEADSELTYNADSIKDTSIWIELRQKISDELSQKIMPMLEEFAGNYSYWIISPDAELNLIPFETLMYRGKMLIENVNVSYVPSLAVLKLMKEAGEKNNKLLNRNEFFAMGNAVYRSDDKSETRGIPLLFSEYPNVYNDLIKRKLKNLPGTIKEIEQVSKLFPESSQKILIGNEASERNLKLLDQSGELARYKNILLAAHGIFLPTNPELSSIVLSQGMIDEKYDGYVTVGEWMSYDFNSDLIYLSACESGRGDYQAGEGIVGIPYALTVAGNKDTVMSLWKVNDEKTAEFVSTFFRKLRGDGKSEVEALNDTKREFLKQNDVSIWAAFLLYGI